MMAGGYAGSSVILGAVSTTQGFLPPAMTKYKKRTISSPAIGLVVYDTSLNALCVYTGSGSDSGWATVTQHKFLRSSLCSVQVRNISYLEFKAKSRSYLLY